MGCCISNTLSLQHLQTWTQGLETNFFGVLSAIVAFLFTSVYLDCFSTTNQNRSSNGSFESRHSRPQSLRSFWPVVGIESSGRTRYSEHAQSIRFALSTIRFAGFDGKSVIHGLPVLDQTRALDPNHRPKGS